MAASAEKDVAVRTRGESYALSPLQAGMLYQALLAGAAGRSAGFDVEQLSVRWNEELDVALLGRAFTFVARRHPALSCAFQWDDGETPVQFVNADVVVPASIVRLAPHSDLEKERERAAFFESDRARGFDLRNAPLMRVSLLTSGDGRSELVWTFHHILIDGRSFAKVLEEVFVVYDAMAEGVAPTLPAAPPTYHEFVAWLGKRDSAASRDFFGRLLAGKVAPTPLPCAEPRRQVSGAAGSGEIVHLVDRATRERAAKLAQRTGTTLATVVHAAWAIVLWRFTGDSDVIFGSTRSCRRSALEGAAENMVGLFINTLPMRARMSAATSVRELLEGLRAQSLALREHEHTPLVAIQKASELAASSALFESFVMFEPRPLGERLRSSGHARLSRCEARLYEQPSPPLAVVVGGGGDALELRLLFHRHRLTSTVAQRLAEALALTISELAEGEERVLGDLEIVPRADRARLVDSWNDTATPFADDRLIHEPFEERARTSPDAIAVEMDGERLTFAELDAKSNRLAHLLRERGAKPGVYVAICLARGIPLVVALLGVAKSGAAYVPLDPQYPRERLSFMVADSRAAVVVTESAYRTSFDAPAIVVDDEVDARVIASAPCIAPTRLATSTDTCYAIYTSGSTGAPKGVVLSHRAVINTFEWVSRSFAVTAGDRLLFVTSPCFDLSVYDTFGALGAGATVVVASEPCLQDPARLAAAIVSERITIWDSAPAALLRLVPFFSEKGATGETGGIASGIFEKAERGESEEIAGNARSSEKARIPEKGSHWALRLVLLSGDYIPLSLPDAVRDVFPAARVVSLGGATEAAIWSNWFPIGAIDSRWNTIPYGRPIQNARYHVLDSQMRLVPIGVMGDLYIGGACLADGYLHRDELTNERFVRDPFRPGERLYKTGDLARYFEDGNLEFLGRADFQVKIRGFRVEMGEVEATLCALPGVSTAVCSAFADATGQRFLVAYVVSDDGIPNVDELREKLALKLPSYMVPAQIVCLDALPLSSNAKLDRKGLPHPHELARADRFVAPRTDVERAMVTIWEGVLGRRPIGVTDDFFKLGGHSLLAVMLVSRIKKQLGVEVPLSRVMERPTIERLADSLTRGEAEGEARHVITLRKEGSRPPLFLLPGAGGYSFIYKDLPSLLGPDQPVYAVQAIGVEGRDTLVDYSIEEMAAIYEREITAACPRGPLILAGYSFGVLVAFELVKKLRAQGREVPLLVSLDGFAPGFPRLMRWPERIVSHVEAFLRGDGERKVAYLRGRFANVKRRVRRRLGRDEEIGEVPFADAELNQRLGGLWSSLWRARDRYHPGETAACELLLLKAEVPARWIGSDMHDPLYGWNAFVTGQIAMQIVPGEHLRLFDGNNQRRIASAIAQHIDLFVAAH